MLIKYLYFFCSDIVTAAEINEKTLWLPVLKEVINNSWTVRERSVREGYQRSPANVLTQRKIIINSHVLFPKKLLCRNERLWQIVVLMFPVWVCRMWMCLCVCPCWLSSRVTIPPVFLPSAQERTPPAQPCCNPSTISTFPGWSQEKTTSS